MPMVPLSFVLATVLLAVLWRELTETTGASRNRFMVTFITLLTLNLALIGMRYGYGFDWIARIQPFTSALLTPAAYLAFRNPTSPQAPRYGLWIHLLPLAAAGFAVAFAIALLDIFQGAFAFAYAIALALLGMQGQDALPWARLNRITGIERALWLVVILLLISGVTDLVIATDFWFGDGQHTARIVGITTAVAVFLTACVLFRFGPSFDDSQTGNSPPPGPRGDDTKDSVNVVIADEAQRQVFADVERLMGDAKLHRDPDLNLNRIARKLGVPARQVSTAINRAGGMTVSRYVNHQRMTEVCHLLETTDLPVTQVMTTCGYNTKSNFNREFKRFTGSSPSEWRIAKRGDVPEY